ncbi:FtsK/SpoIIIE domain-containing protein [Micrococcus terreus]|uniref:FtsK/SpoIIIE domain-containing protein n=1 Tax=Micrococcus terreus TaxID=574650 RepID=UPI0021A71AEC|nr:FtsK/SpoIIIE domain-containing protein [Micrococcus terreus]MCT2088308.1 FtsK/SpoIIIE domain-containing protein [Micrococcus terreus]
MLVRILGLNDGQPALWEVAGRLPASGAELEQVLTEHLPGMAFGARTRTGLTVPLHRLPGEDICRARGTGRPLQIVARPHRDARDHHSARSADDGPELVLVTRSGADSGRLVPLARAGLTVGRSSAQMRIADPCLSALHLRVALGNEDVLIHQDGTVRPWIPGTPLCLGETELHLVRGSSAPLRPAGPLPPLRVAPGPPPARPSWALQAVMALSPLLIGVVMAVVTGHWYFLLFSSVSVLVAAVLWHQHRRAQSDFGRTISELTDRLVMARGRSVPDPADVALACRSIDPDRCGLRHPAAESGSAPSGDEESGPVLHWGHATVTVPLDLASPSSARTRQKLDPWSTTRAPAVSPIGPGHLTVVRGRPAEVEAVLHWVLLQLLRDAQSSGRGVLLRREGQDRHELMAAAEVGRGGTVLSWGGSPATAPPGWGTVHLTSSPAKDPPGTQEDLVELHHATARLEGVTYTQLQWAGISSATLDWMTDELLGVPLPAYRQLCTSSATELVQVSAAPPQGSAVRSLLVQLDLSDEPTVLDLVADGPHVLVAGTTGSGKSELVLSLLMGLASRHGPAEVSFILLDFKGGSSFSVLDALPHTMSVETNLTGATSMRALDALSAELHRRERLFLDAHVPDYPAYRSRHPDQVLPRLIVAVDELRVLVDEHPQATSVLMRLAATGRSLGFHLLLATQRAQGAVGPEVRSNMGTVISLRTASEQESWDLVGSADAAAIPADEPGRAVMRRGGRPLERFRTARFAALSSTTALRPWHPQSTEEDASVASWSELVEHVSTLCRSAGLLRPEPVVLPGLPERWSAPASPDGQAPRPGEVPLGLVDEPRRRRQQVHVWRPFHDGPAAWIGTESGGLPEVARALLDQMGHDRVTSGSSHLVILDGGGWLPRPAHRSPSGCDSTDLWLSQDDLDPDALGRIWERLSAWREEGDQVLIVATQWGRIAGQRTAGTFETFEERLATLLRDSPARLISAAVFGGRELAGGRLLGLIPTRFHVPYGTTPEHRMVWPSLIPVHEVPARAVLIDPDHPAPGVAVQLSVAEH